MPLLTFGLKMSGTIKIDSGTLNNILGPLKHKKHIDLNDILEQLQVDKEETDISTQYIVTSDECAENYTLMQFAAKNGLCNFVDALLNNNIDPNFAGGDKGNKDK